MLTERYFQDTRCGSFSVEGKLISIRTQTIHERDASDCLLFAKGVLLYRTVIYLCLSFAEQNVHYALYTCSPQGFIL